MNLYDAGPRSRATHWKQTVLYLEDVLTICQGEALSGSMTVAPNKKNPRDIDIMIKYSLNGRRCVASRTQHYKMRWVAWTDLQIARVGGLTSMLKLLPVSRMYLETCIYFFYFQEWEKCFGWPKCHLFVILIASHLANAMGDCNRPGISKFSFAISFHFVIIPLLMGLPVSFYPFALVMVACLQLVTCYSLLYLYSSNLANNILPLPLLLFYFV
jgi:hypothetical protein